MLHIFRVLELNSFKKKFKNFIDNKNIKTNVYRMRANDSAMCGLDLWMIALDLLILCSEIKVC